MLNPKKKQLRFFLLISLFSVTSVVSAQPLPDNIKPAFKTDDSEAISKFTTPENIDACYDAGNSSYTVLALSIKLNAKQSFKTLVDEQADLEKSCASKTPLMYAAKYGKLEMVIALITAGANHQSKSNKGLTAIDYAKKYKRKEIYTYLKSLK